MVGNQTLGQNSKPIDKAVRLIEYLLKLAILNTKPVRNIGDYEKTLWISDIPQQEECFTSAWGPNEDYDSAIWLEVKNRKEPQLPSIPSVCKNWIFERDLRNKKDLPTLLSEISVQETNPDWRKDDDEQPQFIDRKVLLAQHPEIQQAWDSFVDNKWLPWVEEHNIWESVHKVYAHLFTIYQEQLRLGEEYELVLGLDF